ncbi:MAG: phospholipase D-like domain-containing protein [Candidatus Latescibacterota bacterium]
MVKRADALRMVCPYIRREATETVLRGARHTDSVRVLTLWSWPAFATGASDLDAFEYLESIGAQTRALHGALHAKVYIADQSAAVVTSANLSDGGLRGNLECGVVLEGPEVAPLVQAAQAFVS